jgi:hypothetical protein
MGLKYVAASWTIDTCRRRASWSVLQAPNGSKINLWWGLSLNPTVLGLFWGSFPFTVQQLSATNLKTSPRAWHTKGVLTADVGQVVDSLWHLSKLWIPVPHVDASQNRIATFKIIKFSCGVPRFWTRNWDYPWDTRRDVAPFHGHSQTTETRVTGVPWGLQKDIEKCFPGPMYVYIYIVEMLTPDSPGVQLLNPSQPLNGTCGPRWGQGTPLYVMDAVHD